MVRLARSGQPQSYLRIQGGRARVYRRPRPGRRHVHLDVRYYDIVPDNRIVYAYDMHLNGERISVSVATVEFRPEGPGTRLIVTEYGAFLDRLDTNKQREEGTNFIIDQLGAWLDKQAAN
jgi:uncharacterized protein YndB with AHSA1/START domain